MTTSPIETPGRPTHVVPLAKAPSLDAKPMHALYVPIPSDAYAPPLDIAIRFARRDLAVQQTANTYDHTAMVAAATVLEVRLRLLLDALDADRAAIVRPLAERQDGAA